jgi:hypothetical protein
MCRWAALNFLKTDQQAEIEMLHRLGRCKSIASLALLLFWGMTLEGCSRFVVQQRPVKAESEAEPLSVTVDIYQSHGNRHKQKPHRDNVLASLLYKKQDRWQVVARSDRGHWTTGGLVPGRYRVEVAGLITEDGELQPLSGPQVQDIKLKDGHAASVAVVVNRTSTAVKVLIVATIVLVVVLALFEIFDGDDFDVGAGEALTAIAQIPRLLITYPDLWLNLLDTASPAPPPVEDSSWIEQVPGSEQSEDEAEDEDQPVVQDYYPRHESTQIAPDADIRLEFDRPMSAWTLSPNTIFVYGSESGEITRGVDYFDDRFIAVIDPLRDFKPGETVTVSIDGGGIASDDGEVLGKSYRFTFHVAGPASPSAAASGL